MLLLYTLAHYFFPRHSNNHKARILHASTLALLSLSLLTYQIVLQLFPITGLKILGYAANISPTEVVSLTNKKREDAGLSKLEFNSALSQAAKAKGEHMLANDYWAHVAPDGTEPWSFFVSGGYKYRYAGENLARDFSDPNSAVEAWMASPSHRDNMLSSKYKEIGVAVVEGDLGGVDTTIVVQFFGTSLIDTTPQAPIADAQASTLTNPTPTVAALPTLAPSPTLFPSPTPIAIAVISPTETRLIAQDIPSEETAKGIDILISPFQTTKSISLITIALLLFVLVVDAVVTSKRRIARIGGRTFAHLAFLGMVLAIVLIIKAGEVL